jgi:hypothetical protein
MKRTIFKGVLLASVCLLLTDLGVAKATGPAKQSATFSVTMIKASSSGAGVDRELLRFNRYFESRFKRFRRFQHIGLKKAIGAKGKAQRIDIPGTGVLTLTNEGMTKGFTKVRLELGGLRTVVSVRDGGLFFQAGRSLGDGVLLLAIEVKAR